MSKIRVNIPRLRTVDVAPAANIALTPPQSKNLSIVPTTGGAQTAAGILKFFTDRSTKEKEDRDINEATKLSNELDMAWNQSEVSRRNEHTGRGDGYAESGLSSYQELVTSVGDRASNDQVKERIERYGLGGEKRIIPSLVRTQAGINKEYTLNAWEDDNQVSINGVRSGLLNWQEQLAKRGGVLDTSGDFNELEKDAQYLKLNNDILRNEWQRRLEDDPLSLLTELDQEENQYTDHMLAGSADIASVFKTRAKSEIDRLKKKQISDELNELNSIEAEVTSNTNNEIARIIDQGTPDEAVRHEIDKAATKMLAAGRTRDEVKAFKKRLNFGLDMADAQFSLKEKYSDFTLEEMSNDIAKLESNIKDPKLDQEVLPERLVTEKLFGEKQKIAFKDFAKAQRHAIMKQRQGDPVGYASSQNKSLVDLKAKWDDAVQFRGETKQKTTRDEYYDALNKYQTDVLQAPQGNRRLTSNFESGLLASQFTKLTPENAVIGTEQLLADIENRYGSERMDKVLQEIQAHDPSVRSNLVLHEFDPRNVSTDDEKSSAVRSKQAWASHMGVSQEDLEESWKAASFEDGTTKTELQSMVQANMSTFKSTLGGAGTQALITDQREALRLAMILDKDFNLEPEEAVKQAVDSLINNKYDLDKPLGFNSTNKLRISKKFLNNNPGVTSENISNGLDKFITVSIDSFDLVPLNTDAGNVDQALKDLKINISRRGLGKFFTSPDEESAQLFYQTGARGSNNPTYEPVMRLELDSSGEPVKDEHGNLRIKPVVITYKQAASFSAALEEVENKTAAQKIRKDLARSLEGARLPFKSEQQQKREKEAEVREKTSTEERVDAEWEARKKELGKQFRDDIMRQRRKEGK